MLSHIQQTSVLLGENFDWYHQKSVVPPRTSGCTPVAKHFHMEGQFQKNLLIFPDRKWKETMSSPKKGQLSASQLKLLQLKKEELKDEARRRSLPLHGNKIDLVSQHRR